MKAILEAYLKDKVNQYKEINYLDVFFSEDMLKYCQANHCGQYNKNWMCPPSIIPIEKLNQSQKYQKAFIFNHITKLSDSFDYEGMKKGRKKVEKILLGLRQHLNSYKDYQIIGVGSCSICPSCTYPDAPCRFPNLASPSMEAIGIDVLSLSKKVDMKYNNGINTVTYFAMIIY